MHRKINLSCYLKLLLFLVCYWQNGFSQSHLVSVKFENGKLINNTAPVDHISFFKSGSGGNQRTFVVNDIITLTITVTGSVCGEYNGSIIAIASGGVAPYTFALSNGLVLNTGNFPTVAPGNYILTVTDANANAAIANITVPNTFDPPVLSLAGFTETSGCNTHDASVTFSASGGTPPYQYSMDGINYQAGNIFSNLYAGIYDFFVKDANGCPCSPEFVLAFNKKNINYRMLCLACS